MRYDIKGLLGGAAKTMMLAQDGARAFALYELADNLAELMRGECSMDEFRKCYTGENGAPFIHGELIPGDPGYADAEKVTADA